VIIYSTMNLSRYRVEVCMQFNGRTSCRTTSGSTEEFALRTAMQNACAENRLRCDRFNRLRAFTAGEGDVEEVAVSGEWSVVSGERSVRSGAAYF